MLKKLTIAITFASLTACTLGPKLSQPEVNVPQQFAYAPNSAEAVGINTWRSFNEPKLIGLIERALAENTTIKSALARYDEAKAYRGLTKYSLFPTVTASGEQIRSKPSSNDPQLPPDIGETKTSDIGADVSWEIDLFGSLRNQSAAVILRLEAADAALADMRRVIVAEVAVGYFNAIGAQARLQTARDNLANLEESERIVVALVDAGRGNDLDLSRARSLRLSVVANVANLEAELARQQLRLATLTNQSSTAVTQLLADTTSLQALPELSAVGSPELWLERRPDVRQAAKNFAVANRDVGTQMAEYFPKLTLLGGFGSVASKTDDLFEAQSERWRYGPSLSWQFLNFGRVKQYVSAAEARVDGAAANYQETVLRALEEIESAFANFRAANASASALSDAADAAERAQNLAQLRFEAGASDYLVVLDANRQYLQLRDQAIQAQVARGSALALVYKALAGDFLERKKN